MSCARQNLSWDRKPQMVTRNLWWAMPREMFLLLRFRWWFLSSYLPRLVTSRLVRRTPQVRDFGAALVSLNLAKQLQSVNVLAPTDMCRVMTRCASDKGRSNNYTPLYSALFKERADIDRGILFEEDRIKTLDCDQLD